jgi:hypothetical protein
MEVLRYREHGGGTQKPAPAPYGFGLWPFFFLKKKRVVEFMAGRGCCVGLDELDAF